MTANLREHFGVADDDDTVLGTGQGNVETARVIQETNTLMLIGSYARQDDEVLLSTLKRVNAGDLYLLWAGKQAYQRQNLL